MPKRREGPVLNKQTGYYFFDEIVGFSPDKKRVRISLRTKDPERAFWLWEKEFRKQWSVHYGYEQKKPELVNFTKIYQEFVNYQRDIKHIKEWEMYESRLNIIAECWGDIPISKIGKDHFIKLDQYLRKEKRSEYTINHYFGLLKTLFNYAILEGEYKGENPINQIKPYVVDRKRREFSLEEMGRIIDAAEQIEKDAQPNASLQKYAKRIVLLLFYTGMRSGEVFNLKWENIREDRITLQRTETKQKKEKIIPLTDGLKNVLESLRDGRSKNPYVIPRRRYDEKNPKDSHAKSLIQKIRKYSKIDDFVFHNIRHTASTIMVSEALGKGVGMADVMKILGHSQIKTTMKYLHSDFDRMKTAMKTLEEKAGK